MKIASDIEATMLWSSDSQIKIHLNFHTDSSHGGNECHMKSTFDGLCFLPNRPLSRFRVPSACHLKSSMSLFLGLAILASLQHRQSVSSSPQVCADVAKLYELACSSSLPVP